jgi:hypothetical protein
MNPILRLLSLAAVTVAASPSITAQVTATNTTIGAGCIATYASFYEFFASSAAFDLSNTTLTMIPSAGGYFVLAGTTTFLAPSANATVLPLGDDTETTIALPAAFSFPGGTTTSLNVASNGYVSVGSNGTFHIPSASLLLSASNTGWWSWHDYNPTIVGGGRVKFEMQGAIACITWDGVWDFGGLSASSANTFQFQFDTATGTVHLVFQTMSTGGNARLVGFSPAGASLDPGPKNLSAALPPAFQTGAVDNAGLTLTASSRPILGGTWTQTVSNVPANATLGVDVLGLTDPGFNDLTFLGLPGCGLRSSLEVVSPWGPIGSTHTFVIGLPANPALLNNHLYTTAAVFVPGVNAFGAISANGIDGLLGNQ